MVARGLKCTINSSGNERIIYQNHSYTQLFVLLALFFTSLEEGIDAIIIRNRKKGTKKVVEEDNCYGSMVPA